MEFENFKIRMQATGSNIREERISAVKAMIAETFVDDPAYAGEVKEHWSGVTYHPRIFENKDRAAGTPQVQFQTQYHEPFEAGDVFLLPDGEYWMCTYKPHKFGMYHQGTIDFCNYVLRIRNETEDIADYPIYLQNSTQYNSGETTYGQINYGSSQQLVFITATPVTIAIDHGYRFLIDRNKERPTAYRLTQIDPTHCYTGGKGILRWTLTEDMLRPTDDIGNMVADTTPAKPQDGKGDGWY